MAAITFSVAQIAEKFPLKISATKTKTMASKGKCSVRSKVILDKNILEEVNYL